MMRRDAYLNGGDAASLDGGRVRAKHELASLVDELGVTGNGKVLMVVRLVVVVQHGTLGLADHVENVRLAYERKRARQQ